MPHIPPASLNLSNNSMYLATNSFSAMASSSMNIIMSPEEFLMPISSASAT